MYYEKELNAISKSNRFRERKIFDENLIDFASNDYLGLTTKKDLFYKACKIVEKEQFFASKSSLLVNGYSKIHKQFEEKLSTINDFEKGIVVGSGFLANISLIEALVRKKDILFIDEDYHASGILASKLTTGKVIYFNHNDYQDLENKIKQYPTNRKIIAIEGVYSMLGDIAPKEFNDIAIKYNSILLVDEAHSSGVIGDNLLGWYDYWKIDIQPNHIKMGTLGKAYGSYGAYILASNHIITYLTNRAKPIIYSTAPSLFDIALGLVSLEYIIDNKVSLKKKIKEHQQIVKDILNIKIEALIVPIELNDNKKVISLQKMVIENGYLIGAIRQPTVKKAILRIILKLDISIEDTKNMFILLSNHLDCE
jgi:8-amino-7-oxononanoate synthase